MDRSGTFSATLKRRFPLLKQGAPTASNHPGSIHSCYDTDSSGTQFGESSSRADTLARTPILKTHWPSAPEVLLPPRLGLASASPEILVPAGAISAMQVQQPLRCLLTGEALD